MDRYKMQMVMRFIFTIVIKNKIKNDDTEKNKALKSKETVISRSNYFSNDLIELQSFIIDM